MGIGIVQHVAVFQYDRVDQASQVFRDVIAVDRCCLGL